MSTKLTEREHQFITETKLQHENTVYYYNKNYQIAAYNSVVKADGRQLPWMTLIEKGCDMTPKQNKLLCDYRAINKPWGNDLRAARDRLIPPGTIIPTELETGPDSGDETCEERSAIDGEGGDIWSYEIYKERDPNHGNFPNWWKLNNAVRELYKKQRCPIRGCPRIGCNKRHCAKKYRYKPTYTMTNPIFQDEKHPEYKISRMGRDDWDKSIWDGKHQEPNPYESQDEWSEDENYKWDGDSHFFSRDILREDKEYMYGDYFYKSKEALYTALDMLYKKPRCKIKYCIRSKCPDRHCSLPPVMYYLVAEYDVKSTWHDVFGMINNPRQPCNARPSCVKPVVYDPDEDPMADDMMEDLADG